MNVVQAVTLLAATITTGLMAGFFTGISYSFMPGLARSSDSTFVETMQKTNKAILNAWFLVPFMGSIPLLGLAAVLSGSDDERAALPWIIAGLVLYLVAFFITSSVNVPLNNELAAAGDPVPREDLAAVRARYEARWVRWNLIRALVHAAAFGCTAWALVEHGGTM
ncbi:DUF1772 domain-containing protein [Spirillospora sp. NBC_00431]